MDMEEEQDDEEEEEEPAKRPGDSVEGEGGEDWGTGEDDDERSAADVGEAMEDMSDEIVGSSTAAAPLVWIWAMDMSRGRASSSSAADDGDSPEMVENEGSRCCC
jgi:hypothetical protein